jgi:hypothetical protein
VVEEWGFTDEICPNSPHFIIFVSMGSIMNVWMPERFHVELGHVAPVDALDAVFIIGDFLLRRRGRRITWHQHPSTESKYTLHGWTRSLSWKIPA